MTTQNRYGDKLGAITLKPCPFCGSESVIDSEQVNGICYVYCNSCGAYGPDCNDKGDAVRLWNERNDHK